MNHSTILFLSALGVCSLGTLHAETEPVAAEVAALEASMNEIELSEPKWYSKRLNMVTDRENRVLEHTGPERSIYMRAEIDATGHVVGFGNNGVPITDDDFAALAAALPKLNWINMGHWGPGRRYKEQYTIEDFDGSGLRAFAGTGLRRAKFGGTRFDNEGLKALLEVPDLEELYLNHSQIDDEGLRLFAAHPSLKVLEINASFSKKYTNETLQILSTYPNLEHLSVGSTWLTYEGGLEHIATMENLKSFTLQWCVVLPADVEKLKAARPDLTVEVIDISKTPGSRHVYPRLSTWVPAEVLAEVGVTPSGE